MKDQPFFQDKVVLITGASSGIGRATALILAQLNGKVVLASRIEEKLKALRQKIEFKGGQGLVIQTDVCSFEGTQRMVMVTITKQQRVLIFAC